MISGGLCGFHKPRPSSVGRNPWGSPPLRIAKAYPETQAPLKPKNILPTGSGLFPENIAAPIQYDIYHASRQLYVWICCSINSSPLVAIDPSGRMESN